MEKRITGKVVLLGDNVDTDQIYPGRFLAIVDPEEIGRHCLAGIDEETRKLVSGSIVVAGTNFGCGSSREHAVIALMNAGVKAVAAESFARIFFRNAINLGLPLVICKEIHAHVKTGQQIQLDVSAGTVTVQDTGDIIPSEKLSDHILSIIEAGGIKPLFRAKYNTLPMHAVQRS